MKFFISIILYCLISFPVFSLAQETEEKKAKSKSEEVQLEKAEYPPFHRIPEDDRKPSEDQDKSKSGNKNNEIDPIPEGTANSSQIGVRPDFATPESRNTNVKVDNQSGHLNLGYSFVLPGGRVGLQPELSANYSSAEKTQNSWIGYGWNLSIPYIKRVNKNGVNKLFNREDYISFYDGEMVQIGNNQFRAKIDHGSFRRYSLQNNEWIMEDKSGNVYRFGSQANSRLTTPQNANQTVIWYLTSIEDPSGNSINYSYQKSISQQQIYPDVIFYLGSKSQSALYTVKFLRESRSDPIEEYFLGFKSSIGERIRAIEVRLNGQWYKKYELSYTVGDNGRKSMLASITEIGKDLNSGLVKALPPTQFFYSKTTPSWTQQSQGMYGAGSGQHLLSFEQTQKVDINGDAYVDFVGGTISINNPSGNYYTHLHSGNNFWRQDLPGYHLPTTLFWGTSITLCSTIGDKLGSRLVDLNGDLFIDILEAQDVHSRLCPGWGAPIDTFIGYLNYLGNSWTPDTNYKSDLTFIQKPPSSRSCMDLNGDGLPEIFDESGAVQLNNGNGFDSLNITDWNWPKHQYSSNPNYWAVPSYPYMHTHDFNGDGNLDIMYITNLTVAANAGQSIVLYLGNGKGQWFLEMNWAFPPLGLNGGQANGIFIDINSDGLIDYLSLSSTGSPSKFPVYLNQGDGWYLDWNASIPDFLFSPASDNLIDVNADGLIDHIRYAGNNVSSINFNLGPGSSGTFRKMTSVTHDGMVPDLLVKIKYPEGSEYNIVYKPSTHYKDSVGNLKNPQLPIVVQTVHLLISDDNNGNLDTTKFEYAGGHYFYENAFNRRFAGFGKVTKTNAYNHTNNRYYHLGNGSQTGEPSDPSDGSLIGKVYKEELFDNDLHRMRTVYTQWTNHNLGNDRDFVYPTQSWMDEDGKITSERFTYNTLTGNQIAVEQFGKIVINGNPFQNQWTDISSADNRFQEYSYTNTSTNSFPQLISKEILKDHNGNKTAEVQYFYDNKAFGKASKGNLNKRRVWVSGGTYADESFTYDSYGNILTASDPLGNKTAYTYDPYGLYPKAITNAKNQTRSLVYDYRLGQIKQETDINNNTTSYQYDPFGRINKVTSPLGVTKGFFYEDIAFPNFIKESTYLDNNNVVESFTYFDGLGRVIQTKVEHEANQWITTDLVYNPLGQVVKTSLPYFSGTFSHTAPTSLSYLYVTTYFDALGRLAHTQDVTGDQWLSYIGWTLNEINKNNVPKSLSYDAYGNLVEVKEYNNNRNSIYTTTYEYNNNDNLIGYTNASGNIRSFTYDQRGLRLSATDLHASGDTTFGIHYFTYDLAGNLKTHQTPTGVLLYTYDQLNRILTDQAVMSGQPTHTIAYSYDACSNSASGGNTIGRLCSVSDGRLVTSYSYDKLGFMTSMDRSFDGNSYVTLYDHDQQGNLNSFTTPTGETITYSYNNGGMVEKISTSQHGMVVTNFDYSPTGAIRHQVNANGTQTINNYDDAQLYRLTRKTTLPGLQDITYSYDSLGNLIEINDQAMTSIAGRNTYGYDDLNRLIHAQMDFSNGTSQVIDYTYSPTGNIETVFYSPTLLSRHGFSGNTTWRYFYTQDEYTNPQATDSVFDTGTGLSGFSDYDRSGNLIFVRGASPNALLSIASNSWNPRNQLLSSLVTRIIPNGSIFNLDTIITDTKFHYDHNGDRVFKETTTLTSPPPNTGTFFYANPNFYQEVRPNGFTNDVVSIYHPSSGTHIATIYQGRLNFKHNDHLNSNSIVTDSNGDTTQLQSYYPFGGLTGMGSSNGFYSHKTFTDHYLDDESQLTYMGARYYGSWGKRFLSQDPVYLKIGMGISQESIQALQNFLSDPQALNSYTYSRNNPLIFIDPDGQFFVAAAMQLAKEAYNSFVNNSSVQSFAIAMDQTALGHRALENPALAGAGVGVIGGGLFAAASIGLGALGVQGLGYTGTGICLSGGCQKAVELTQKPLGPIQGGGNGLSRYSVPRPSVSDPKLNDFMNKLYRPNATIGNGSTADAVRYTINTGQLVGNSDHVQKAQDSIKFLNRWINRNPTAANVDIEAAKAVVKDLTNALIGK